MCARLDIIIDFLCCSLLFDWCSMRAGKLHVCLHCTAAIPYSVDCLRVGWVGQGDGGGHETG